ncbi:MAG: C1 family peptidase [Candidatus Nanopelagicaceae bacterium]|nr:C1 family peptidase [Candidatus Nanopelagicaceae bacterium]
MKFKLGWRPDLPDVRDFTPEMMKKNGLARAGLAIPQPLPTSVDLRQWCSPIQHQGNLSSCTSHAGVGMYELYENKSFGKHEPLSRLFLYKVTRNLMKETADSGAFLRNTMQAIAVFGVCPENYWEYDQTKVNVEPDQFCYAYAQNYQALTYFRLDSPGLGRPETLQRIKEYLSRGFAIMFGFSVYNSIWGVGRDGRIPFPGPTDRLEGGHAVLMVGYDDAKNAILIRNSWGTEWGENGYGWLPYEYVLQDLAEDFWSATACEWLDSGQFK